MSENVTDSAAEVVLVYTTWPDLRTAETAGAAAVAQRLAACANLLAPMRSIYWWKGQVDTSEETPMLLKTTRGQAEALRDFLIARHPYEVPAVIALDVIGRASHGPFLDWVAAETRPKS